MSTKLPDLTEVCQRCKKPRGAHKANSLSCPVGKKHRMLGYLEFSTTSVFAKGEAAASPSVRPVGMDRSRYPVAPEAIVESLKRLHAGYIESRVRRHHRPVRLADLVADLKIPTAKVSLLRQQLQDMQHHRFAEFGVHHAYYPTGWQVRLPEPTFEETLRVKGKHTHRFAQNPCERTAAYRWNQLHRKPGIGTLDYLLGDGQEPGDVSDRDHLVAATVIQWLGSPVGQGFVRDLVESFDAAKTKRSDAAPLISGDSLAKALLGAVRAISPSSDVPDASSRDHLVAAAVIQWLGSPVGQVFFFELMTHFEASKK